MIPYVIFMIAALFTNYNLNAHYTAGIYLLKVNNKNNRTRCEIFSKLTIKTAERRRFGVSIVNFKHICFHC